MDIKTDGAVITLNAKECKIMIQICDFALLNDNMNGREKELASDIKSDIKMLNSFG